MQYEYTDTFGGEPNYSWVERGEVDSDDLKKALKLAKNKLGLTGVKGELQINSGDFIAWKPRGACTILMVYWQD